VVSYSEVVEKSKVIVMAVKPQILKAVITEVKPKLTKDHLLVSIAAGITMSSLQEWGGDVRVVRVIPNTPSLVGEGVAAISGGPSSTQGDVDLVKALFDSVGKTVVVEEKLLNAVTGVSGSGPAYVYIAIEAMADGGVAAGLPRSVALSLAAQTFLGSAKMVLETKRHPGQLKDEVASPAGTTIAGLHELEKAGFRSAWMNAVVAAAKRGEQLGSSSK
jgi:pyrroline-5-carboxylate reductase